MRSYAPYSAYEALDFQPVSESGGDVFARCAVRADEVRESLRLVREALAQLGSSALPARKTLRIGVGAAVSTVEGPHGVEAVAQHVGKDGKLRRIHIISGSYRNSRLLAHAMSGSDIRSASLINKSFGLCYACAGP